MEGFPSPDAKTIMEAMEDDESERTSADLSEDERQDREIALVFDQLERLMVRRKMTSRELVEDIQLADDDEDDEEEEAKNLLWEEHVLRVRHMQVSEESTSVELGSKMAMKVFERQVGEEHECRESKERQIVGEFCCVSGFLRKESHQQKEDDYGEKLRIKGRSNLSYRERLLSRERAAVCSTGHRREFCGVRFLVRFDAKIGSKLLSTVERVDKASQDRCGDLVEVGSLEVTVDRGDVKEAVTRTKQRVRRDPWMQDDFFGEYLGPSHLLITWQLRQETDLITRYKIIHDGKTADQKRIGKRWKLSLLQCRERTHYKLLKTEAQELVFGQKLLQGRFVSVHSRSGCLLTMIKEGVVYGHELDRLTHTDRWDPIDLLKLHGLPRNLAEDSTRTQQKMIDGRSDESWEVVQNEDDQEERNGIVRKKNSEHLRGAESYANGAIYAVSVRIDTKRSKECREKVKELRKSRAAERVADHEADPTDRVKESSKAPERQHGCERPSERANEFETERSLEKLLGGVIPSAQRSMKFDYARVRPVEFGMFSSSTAARRRTEISTRVYATVSSMQMMLQDAVVVPTAEDGVEAVAETSDSSTGAEADVEADVKAEQRKGRRQAEITQYVRSSEFEDEDPEVEEKEKQIGRRHDDHSKTYCLRQDEYVKELKKSNDVEFVVRGVRKKGLDGRVLFEAEALQVILKAFAKSVREDQRSGDGSDKLRSIEKDVVSSICNTAIFYSDEHDAQVLVHKGDLVLLGNDRTVVELNKMLKLRYLMKRTETQIAKPFVKQLRKDNHFDCSRELVYENLLWQEEATTKEERDVKIGKFGCEDDDDEDANLSTRIETTVRRSTRHMMSGLEADEAGEPDEAEGQRQSLTYSDLSKLSLGRMKQRICTDVNDIRLLWIREQVTLRHFVSSKVGTLLNIADAHTRNIKC